MLEIREVEGWDDYGVSADGSVWTRKVRGRSRRRTEWRKKTLTRTSHGYLCVTFQKGRSLSHRFYVHQLVLEAFVGKRPSPNHQAAHGNGISTDNRLCNLRWATATENNHDRWAHGTMPVGASHQNAKLTEEEVLRARRLRRAGRTYRSIAAELQVDFSTIYKAAKGITWAHLPQERSA